MRTLIILLCVGFSGCATGPYALKFDVDGVRSDVDELTALVEDMRADVDEARVIATQANAAAQDALQLTSTAQVANNQRLERMFEASQAK